MELIFATNNQHKLEEVSAILGSKVKLRSMGEMGFDEDIPEPYDTFEANALTKAETIFSRFSISAFADDSGLEIDALNKEPGVLSARYAGQDCSSQDNIEKVLKEMKGIKERSARFVTVIALIINGEKTLFKGVIEGKILENEQNDGRGFGYDPIFQPEGYDESFAQMDPNTKNTISHRAQAVNKLRNFINNLN